MDRALKERIVGATVLVVAAVLVVPVFLDGPPADAPAEQPMVERRIDLPGQEPDDGVRTVVLDRNRSEPLPANSPVDEGPAAGEADTANRSAVADSPPQETTATPAATPAPVAAAAADTASEREPEEASSPAGAGNEPEAPPPAAARPGRSTTGMWAVQLGSFSTQANADRLAAELRQQGFAAFLSRLETPDGELHRVRVGPQRDRDGAEAMAARLERAGQKGQVVPHP